MNHTNILVLFVLIEHEDEHLGFMGLSSVLAQRGYSCQVVKADVSSVCTAIDKDKTHKRVVLAYSPTLFSLEYYLKLNNLVKKKNNVFSVFGGYCCSGKPEIVEEEGVDAVCIGEGEYPFAELVERLDHGDDPSDILNLWIKQGQTVRKNPLRPLIADLDSLPFPDRDLFKSKSFFFRDRCYIMTSRGCGYACPHCYNSTYRNLHEGQTYYRRRSVDHVIAEILDIQKRFKLRFIIFYDDIFAMESAWLEEFSEKYKRMVNIPFRCNVRIDLLTSESVARLKEANCHVISFGVETGNDGLLKDTLKRRMSTAEMLEKARMAKSYGLKLRTTNMIGIPGGSILDDLETMRFNSRCKVDYAIVSMFRAYSNTDFSLRENNRKEREVRFRECDERPGYDMHEAGMLRRLTSSFSAPENGFIRQEEVSMTANLHELFSVGVSFPRLFPLIKMLIRLPLRRFYRYLNFLWAYHCSFFVLCPTTSFGVFLKDLFRYKCSMLFKEKSRKD